MFEFAQRLGFDLPNAFARNRELFADLLQGVVAVHAEAKAHAYDPLLAWRQCSQHACHSVAQIRLDRGVDGQDNVLVFNQVAELGVPFFADRSFEREWLLSDLQGLAYLFKRHMELRREFLGRWVASELTKESPAHPHC